jgi:fumarylacetoacetase
LLGSGTISGPDDGSEGCLLEITRPGGRGIELPTGERRGFLEDGDEVILRARCARDGFRSIGFGDCVGLILPVPG